MNTPQNELEPDESSGVTSLRPMPVKPARFADLAESDSTSYFSASELLERGKALASKSSESVPPTPRVLSEPEATPSRLGALAQFRQASLPRKVSVLLLPLLCGLLLLKPPVKRPAAAAAAKPSSSISVPMATTQQSRAAPQPSPAAALLALPRGVTLSRAAADSVATGDFSRAAMLYRELARREPTNHVYGEAARILSERPTTQTH